jgi:hypothetical protein
MRRYKIQATRYGTNSRARYYPYKPAQAGRLSPLTVQGYARTLKAFFSWLVRDEHLVTNPMKLVNTGRAFLHVKGYAVRYCRLPAIAQRYPVG